MNSNKTDKKTKQNRDAENPRWRKEIGLRISKAREKSGMSQNELADKLGVNRVTLTYWENGTRDIKTTDIVRLADELGVTCDYILRGVEAANIDINKAMGLSEHSIRVLKNLKKHHDYMEELYPGKHKSGLIEAVNTMFEKLEFTEFWSELSLLPRIDFTAEDYEWLVEDFYENYPLAAEYIYSSGADILSATEKAEWQKSTCLKNISEYIETAFLIETVPEPTNLPKYNEVVNGSSQPWIQQFKKGGLFYADNNETE